MGILNSNPTPRLTLFAVTFECLEATLLQFCGTCPRSYGSPRIYVSEVMETSDAAAEETNQ